MSSSTSPNSSEGQEPFFQLFLSDETRDEASAWLAGKGISLDTAFDWMEGYESNGGTQPAVSELDLAPPALVVSLGQLPPSEEEVYYLSPDHPDQGYSRLYDLDLGPLMIQSAYNSILFEENETIRYINEDIIRRMNVIPWNDSLSELNYLNMVSEMKVESVLYDDAESDEEHYDTDSDEDELDE